MNKIENVEKVINTDLPECPYCGEVIGVIDADLDSVAEEEIFKQNLRVHLFRHLRELDARVTALEKSEDDRRGVEGD